MKNIYGYTELLEDLIKLREASQNKICVKFAGKSVKGRLLPLIKAGKGSKKLLLAGAIHGREYVSSLFIIRSLEMFLKDDGDFCGCSLYFLPMLNPDGAEIAWGRDFPIKETEDFKAEFFKNNANNINLNANFPFCFSKVPKSRQGGSAPASQPEVKALIKLCEEERFASAISVHARGNCIFWRDFGNKVVNGDKRLAQGLEETCGFELIKPTQSPQDYSGGFENWFRYRYRRPALCVELVKDEDISFHDMINDFEEAVIWDKTKHLLNTYINFS